MIEEARDMIAEAQARGVAVVAQDKGTQGEAGAHEATPEGSSAQDQSFSKGLQLFKNLMRKGIEVLKHREAKGKSVKWILYLTPNHKYLVCCRTKGQPEQKHMHSLQVIHSVEHSYDKEKHFMVFGGKKGEDLLLELEVVTKAARNKLVTWLQRLVLDAKGEEKRVAVTVVLDHV
jgi:hypothetical protein